MKKYLVLGLTLAVLFLTPFIYKILNKRNINITNENQIGEVLLQEYFKSYPKISHQKLESEIKDLVVKVFKGTNNLNIHIVNRNSFVVHSLPGNHLLISKRILEQTQYASVLLAAVAHELIHLQEKDFLWLQLQSGKISDADLLMKFTQQASQLVYPKYTQAMEEHADEGTFDLLVDSKVDPHGAIEYFQELLEESEASLADGHNDPTYQAHQNLQKKVDYFIKYANKTSVKEVKFPQFANIKKMLVDGKVLSETKN